MQTDQGYQTEYQNLIPSKKRLQTPEVHFAEKGFFPSLGIDLDFRERRREKLVENNSENEEIAFEPS